MAYKFQLGNAKLGGTLQQDGGLVSTNVDDATAANIVSEIDAGEIPGDKLAIHSTDPGLESVNDSGQKLRVKLKANTGLARDGDGVSGVADGSKAIQVGAAGFGVKIRADKGVGLHADGLELVLENNKGLEVGASGLAIDVKANSGLAFTGNEIGVALATNKGLEFDSGALAMDIKANSGLAFTGNELGVSLHSDALQFDGAAIDLKDSIAGNRAFAGQVEVAQTLKFGNTGNCDIRLNDTAHNTAGKRLEIRAGGPVAGTTSDVAGGNLELLAGAGKGTGAGGNIEFRVATAAGSTANTVNNHVTAMTIAQNKNVDMQADLALAGDMNLNGGALRMGAAQNAEVVINDTAHNVAGKELLLRAGSTTAGTTADVAGGAVVIEAGRGKGTGVGGSISFKVATAAGSTGNTLNNTATAMTIAQNKNVDMQGDLVVQGDLTVQGATVTLNVANLDVEDKTIKIAKGNNSLAGLNGAGLTLENTGGDDITFLWANTPTKMELKKGSGFADMQAGTITATLAGNASTATALASARNIGGVSFDGSGNITPQNIDIADDENTDANRLIMFAAGAGAQRPSNDGDFHYNPSSGRVTATEFAGNGAALTGVNAGSVAVALKADGNTLAIGFNYIADMSSDGTDVFNLPASPTVGDLVYVKAPSDASAARVARIQRQGSHTIDGENSIDLVSPHAAVSLVYVAANTWKLF